MQLTSRALRIHTIAALALALLLVGSASADSGVGVAATLFHEEGGPLDMTVLTPSARAAVDFGDAVGVHAGWEADIVTGASVAVVDAPSGDVDAITSATQLTDMRNAFRGGLELRGDLATVRADYQYAFENDYRSHSFSIGARTELFERNTAFDITYGRGFDSVCDLEQPRAQEAVDRKRLPSSDGCFSADDRTDHDISLQTIQGAWTQAWTPLLATQLSTTLQLVNGFQSNPYRAVWIGRTAAQEHHPETRVRYALGLGVNYWLKPLSGAIQAFGRVYRDTWDVRSITAELAYEQSIAAGLRVRARGRWYSQTGAAFYSDDYARLPMGQYFTGDRELSPMQTITLGGKLTWSVPASEEGAVLGFMTTLDLYVKADWIGYSFDEFHYAQARVPNQDAIMLTGGLEAVF